MVEISSGTPSVIYCPLEFMKFSKSLFPSTTHSHYSLYLVAPSFPTITNSVPATEHHRLSMLRVRKSSIPISHSSSVRSRSSCDGGSSIGSSASQRPLTVTYKNVTTSGMLFSKKTTSVDCGVYVKDPG